MILYSLPTGRTITMSIEDLLTLDDNDIQMYIAYEQGSVINHPFTESVLNDLSQEEIEEHDEYDDNTLYSNNDIEDFLENDSFGDTL